MKADAFTLIEVLVALGLALLLALGLQSLTVNTYRHARALEDRTETAARLALPLELFRQDLSHLTLTTALTLQHNGLSVATTSSMTSQRSAARHAVEVRYIAVEQGGRWRLTRQEREPNVSGRWSGGTTLAGGLKGVVVEIFDGSAWHRTWPLPDLRPARAAHLVLDHVDGTTQCATVLLDPPRWRRHDD